MTRVHQRTKNTKQPGGVPSAPDYYPKGVTEVFFRTSLTVLFLLGLQGIPADAEKPYILADNELKAIGHIVSLDATERFCYGFTVGDSGLVVTCAHCALSDTMLFRPLWEAYFDTIVQVMKSDPEYDLALYKRLRPRNRCAVKLGDYNATSIGDTVSALIFKSMDSLHLMLRTIDGIFGIEENGKMVEFILISGLGPEGTSGSPVFNSEGAVVAIVSMGKKVPEEGGQLSFKAMAVPLKRIMRYITPAPKPKQ